MNKIVKIDEEIWAQITELAEEMDVYPEDLLETLVQLGLEKLEEDGLDESGEDADDAEPEEP